MDSADAKLSVLAMVELAISSGDNTPAGKVSLSTSDIDALIARLAQIRSSMAPEVPRGVAESTQVSKVVDPLWILHSPEATKDKMLVVRHPGLGWMMFQLSPPEAARLGHALLSGDQPPVSIRHPATSSLH